MTLSFETVSQKEYDFIVVGGGTAGAAVAARLAENPDFKILLIEAGATNPGIPETIVPLLAPQSSLNKPYNWTFKTTGQTGLENREAAYPRGKIIGGTSTVNFTFYIRGSSEDYDRIASITGDDGWSWKSLLPYFQKSERLVPPTDGSDTTGKITPSVHGDSGPILVSLPNSVTPIHNKIIEATGQIPGFPYNEDINSGSSLGFGWLPCAVGGGIRSSSANYLANTKPNLDILTGAHVTRLTFSDSEDSEVPVVTGVEFSSGSDAPRYTTKARNEVILSAGAIGTPHILLLSGVGDRKDLEAHNIPVVKHLPDVGKNLQDHPLILNKLIVNTTETWDQISRDPTIGLDAKTRYDNNFTGPLSNSLAQTVGFFRIPDDAPIWKKTVDPTAGPNTPHVEFLFGDGFLGVVDQVPEIGNFLSIATIPLQPTSVGQIELASADPFAFPIINPNFLDTEHDVAIAIEGIKHMRRFLKAPTFQDHILSEYGDLASAHTDEELEKYIRKNTVPGWHPAGTAALSARGSDTGVLDPDLTVKGVKGLRVADASVLPYITTGHLQAPVYAIGERAADLIKERYTRS